MTEKQIVFIKNGVAVTDSLMIAEVVKKDHDKVMKGIYNQIEKLKEAGMEEFSAANFGESEYINERGKKYSKFDLTEDAFALVIMAYTTVETMVYKVKFIEEFKRIKEELQKQSFIIPKTYKDALKELIVKEEEKEQLLLQNTELKEELGYTKDVNTGLIRGIGLAEMRQFLNRVVRRAGVSKAQSRWGELYKQFNDKFHMNVKTRSDNYNKVHKPKLSKIDYIDKELNQIEDLFDIACKLYESEKVDLIEEILGHRQSQEIVLH